MVYYTDYLRYIGVLSLLLLIHARSLGQEAESVVAAPSSSADTQRGVAGNLDKLLDMADKDIAQLSQVKISSGTTGSPSLDVPVTTASRQKSTVGRTPAAIFVITNEMIRRSGAKTIPDVLRMAPGVEVAQITSNEWAITIRGFNQRFANKLLVQIDGRVVYTPVFGGVYWDEQDLLLEDVDRIEVIRGPGATIWGSNAVNGIINIVTKRAKDTQGVYLESGTGTEELGYTGMRYGGALNDDMQYRFYGKWFERGAGFDPTGEAFDDWRQARGGFRTDWKLDEEDAITFQGDYYNGYSGEKQILPLFVDPYRDVTHQNRHVSGSNALLRWTHTIDEESDWAVQLYYDHSGTHWIPRGLVEDCDTFDLDFQRQFPIGPSHDWIWGFGFRNIRDNIPLTPSFGAIPPSRSYKIISYFVQDRITLKEDRWYLTLGSKFEHNDFTNFEYQPTVRLLWTPDDRRSVWGAVSRAVRLPTRGEMQGYDIGPALTTVPVPLLPYMFGNPYLISEELLAYELGCREQTTKRFSWDLALFLHDYAHLESTTIFDPIPGPGDTFFLPFCFENHMKGKVYGFEWSANYALTEQWKFQGSYSFLVMDLQAVDPLSELLEGQSPRNQFYLQSSWDLGKNWELDVIGRYVDTLPADFVPSYFAGDVRLAWRPRKNFEWSIVGRNLLAGNHQEFGNDYIFGGQHTEVQEMVYTQLIWRR
jgi:iron complex outermembrane recepter protein